MKKNIQMDLEQYKQEKLIRDEKHSELSKKYLESTRCKNTFKVYMHINKITGRVLQVKDFSKNPQKYNKQFKKVICLTDGKIFTSCHECAEYYKISIGKIMYQCRITKHSIRPKAQFMYFDSYRGLGLTNE